MLTHKTVSEPTSNKKDWVVELVPGKTNQIRLRNAHWNREYMYAWDDGKTATQNPRRSVLVYKDTANINSTKKDWEVELVPGTTNQIRLRNAHWNREYMYAAGYTDGRDDGRAVRSVVTSKTLSEPTSDKKDWEIEFSDA